VEQPRALVLGLPASGDVLGDARESVRLSGPVPDGKAAVADPANGPVGPYYPVRRVHHAAVAVLVERDANAGPILGVDRLDPRPRLAVEAFACAAEDLFVRRAHVEDLGVVQVGQPEDLVDVLRDLPEPRLAFSQRRLGPLLLGDVDAEADSRAVREGAAHPRRIDDPSVPCARPEIGPAALRPLHELEHGAPLFGI